MREEKAVRWPGKTVHRVCAALILAWGLAPALAAAPGKAAGTYVLADEDWLPSSLALLPSGKFEWFIKGSGARTVRGDWTQQQERIALRAAASAEAPIYRQLSHASGRFMAADRYDEAVMTVAVLANERMGVAGTEAVLEDEQGRRVEAEAAPIPGYLLARLPKQWGQWRRVGLRLAGSGQAWQWFEVEAASRAERAAGFELTNADAVQPLFRQAELELQADGGLAMPTPEPLKPVRPALRYRKLTRPLTAAQLAGRYRLEGRLESELALQADGQASWSLFAGRSYYLEGRWRVSNGLVMVEAQLPSQAPKYRLMTDEEMKIRQPATARQLIVIVGQPRVGGAAGIEIRFEAGGKILGQAVSNASGDAILDWDGKADAWSRVGLRREGSADAWTWLEVPAARRADRLLAIAIDDLGLSRPAIPSLIFGLGEDGGLLLREPLSFGLEKYFKTKK
ncbi:hypothetical protein [Chromobacterium haemolyticum]|uniref:hypothetical protein n=1 Tax=Chromobacterium haemolyticum TaxID=394935 RepID=UPI00307E4F9D